MYNEEEENFLKKQAHEYEKNIVKSTNLKTNKVLCYAGSKVFRIRTNGDIERCWSYQNKKGFQILGNVSNKKSIKLLDKAYPCYADRCACSYPSEKNTYFYFPFARIFKQIDEVNERINKTIKILKVIIN